VNQRIDHSNYEAWLLDRLEGSLTPEQERELDAFLVLHPELAPEEGGLPTLSESGPKLSVAEKGSLKRSFPPTDIPSAANIDDHLIARLEGDLTPVQLDALRAYLVEHPEHQRAERIYALTKIVPDAMAFAEKRALQRHMPPVGLPTRYNLEDFLVARLEGDLSDEQGGALEAILAMDPAARRAWTLMSATRVEALAIVYPEKNALKKGGRVIAIGSVRWGVRLAAAASVAAIIGLGLWFLLQGAPEVPQVAETPKEMPTTEQVSPGPVGPVRPNEAEPEAGRNGQPSTAPGSVEQQKGSEPSPKPERIPMNGPAQPKRAPIDRDDALPMAEQRSVLPDPQRPNTVPLNVPVPEVPETRPDELAALPAAATNKETTVGELLTATLRERVLDRPAREAEPLDGDDAVAAVDKGLKAVGGERAGLAVDRKADGGVRGFNLRLGRNLAVSAQR